MLKKEVLYRLVHYKPLGLEVQKLLDFLDDHTKDVFKTAFELDQMWIIEHAKHRQKFIDQGQSVNLFFPSDASQKKLHAVHKAAWEGGLKGLYYLRSRSPAEVDDMGAKAVDKFAKKADNSTNNNESTCLACEG